MKVAFEPKKIEKKEIKIKTNILFSKDKLLKKNIKRNDEK